MLKDNFELMAKYNHWMNEKLFNASEKLSEEELAKDVGAFFESILGTLNHIYVADIIWLKRFAEHPEKLLSLEPLRAIATPETLTSRPYSNIESLRQARFELDAVIVKLCKELTEPMLSSILDYKNMKGNDFQNEFSQLIQHFFNHQTHHRGQISTMFNQFQIDVGATDLLVCIRES
ncbi:MAG: damage-inducible protein DinB [SAR86 cluster bacterium]|uniref:Damage-inducible protein DinB n=1 Tax=SAR86 cluster bacterium TaxID=2030880 RepID=A0A2A5B8X9_9GAMM|nr:MAG: damage-inducible protein DinB [SAR86 cluster bacterium]